MARIKPPIRESDPKLAHARKLTLTVYILHALAGSNGVTFFVAIFINYSALSQVAGTIYESHFRWQIRTFWCSLLYSLLGTTAVVAAAVQYFTRGLLPRGLLILGLLLLLASLCWHMYRVIRGLMNWSERKSLYA